MNNVLPVNSTTPEKIDSSFIPYCQHSIDEEEIEEVVLTLKSAWLTSGPKTRSFEKDFADYIGYKRRIYFLRSGRIHGKYIVHRQLLFGAALN